MPRQKKAFSALTMTDAELMAAALIGLEHQRSELAEKMAELRRQLDDRAGRPVRSAAAVNTTAPVVKKRTMSAAGRRRVAAAQRPIHWVQGRPAIGPQKLGKGNGPILATQRGAQSTG